MVYRVAQEALTNTARHAGAGTVDLSLTVQGGALLLVVADDGRGVRGRSEGRASPACGSGLALVGGRLEMGTRHGGGTEVRLLVPPGGGMADQVRILLADDHALVRQGVRMILDAQPDLTVVAEAGDGAEAVGLVRTVEVDLVVLDVAMPRMTGLQAARELTRRREGLPVLILSMHDNEQYFFESLKAGASGYVLKSVADQDLVDACRAAIRGESFVYPGVMSTLVRDYLERMRRGERVPETVLTSREDEVVKLIAEGQSTRDIATALTISPQDRRASPREHPRQARHARPHPAPAMRSGPVSSSRDPRRRTVRKTSRADGLWGPAGRDADRGVHRRRHRGRRRGRGDGP